MIKNIILKPKGPYSLKKLAGFTEDKIIGKSNITIKKISSIENAINGSITFLDNKRKFPWSYGSLIGFSKGSPGRLRVNIHNPISTEGLSKEDRIQLSGKVRDLILKDLSLS